MMRELPVEVQSDLRHADRLEWWTLGWMGSVVVAMWLASGSSQAMKTALIEDVLSLVPAIVFLVAKYCEKKPPTRFYAFGLDRVHSLCALIAAAALVAVGAFPLFDAGITLVAQERPTIRPVRIFGHEIWLGWAMMVALLYSAIPPVILGHIKQPVARRLRDEVLDTDAMMQKADWMTGLAGIVGILGVGLGFWWADAAAGAVISLSILKDGVTSLRVATAELVDGTPRALGKNEVADDAKELTAVLEARYPGSTVRLRETGRYIRAEVLGAVPADEPTLEDLWPGDPKFSWRLVQISFSPRGLASDAG